MYSMSSPATYHNYNCYLSWYVLVTRFSISTLNTPNDLWPPSKSIGSFYLTRVTKILIMTIVTITLFEVHWLQAWLYTHKHACMTATVSIIIKTNNSPRNTVAVLKVTWTSLHMCSMFINEEPTIECAILTSLLGNSDVFRSNSQASPCWWTTYLHAQTAQQH